MQQIATKIAFSTPLAPNLGGLLKLGGHPQIPYSPLLLLVGEGGQGDEVIV